MSLPAMHIATGMVAPYLVGLALYFRKKMRLGRLLLLGVSLVMIACGIWALSPDFLRFVPSDDVQIYYAGTHSKPPQFFNIFFFHGFLDTVQTEERGLYLGSFLILAMYISIFFACARQVRLYKNQIRKYLKEINTLKGY